MNALVRDLVVVDVELAATIERKKKHLDPVSQAGINVTLDGLLDERFGLSPVKNYDLDELLTHRKLVVNK